MTYYQRIIDLAQTIEEYTKECVKITHREPHEGETDGYDEPSD